MFPTLRKSKKSAYKTTAKTQNKVIWTLYWPFTTFPRMKQNQTWTPEGNIDPQMYIQEPDKERIKFIYTRICRYV